MIVEVSSDGGMSFQQLATHLMPDPRNLGCPIKVEKVTPSDQNGGAAIKLATHVKITLVDYYGPWGSGLTSIRINPRVLCLGPGAISN